MPIPQNQILAAEIHVTVLVTAGGSNSTNTDFVFHYRRITVAVPPVKVNLKLAFEAVVMPPLVAALNQAWTSALIRIRWPNDALDQFGDFGNTTAGAITGDRMATEDAAFLLFQTSLR